MPRSHSETGCDWPAKRGPPPFRLRALLSIQPHVAQPATAAERLTSGLHQLPRHWSITTSSCLWVSLGSVGATCAASTACNPQYLLHEWWVSLDSRSASSYYDSFLPFRGPVPVPSAVILLQRLICAWTLVVVSACARPYRVLQPVVFRTEQ